MKNRDYNIFFNLHTISGIIISALLYVIFFAGSFSFFRDEIVNWENNTSAYQQKPEEVNFNRAIDSLAENYQLYSRDISFNNSRDEYKMGVNLGRVKDSTLIDAKPGGYIYLNNFNYQESSYVEGYGLGEFLYRLHFFAQIPYPYGYYLSGFVSLFFVFVIITGVLVHWKKIVSNFYIFRPWAKLKTLWTDAHTALGTIGLPFQLVFAVTGAFFMIKAVLLGPLLSVLYDGNQTQLYQNLGYSFPTEELNYQKEEGERVNINAFVKETAAKWEDFIVEKVHINNYGDASMKVTVAGRLDYVSKFTGLGEIKYDAYTREVLSEKKPYQKASYVDVVKTVLYRLHLGDYGNYAIRVLYFILGIIGCFIIVSGIIIWQVARDKKSVPERKRKFNFQLLNIYMAVCMSMYPLIAMLFILIKTKVLSSQIDINSFFFIAWLLVTIGFVWLKNYKLTTKYSLLSGAIIGLGVPVASKLSTGIGFWQYYQEGKFDLFFIDFFWLMLSLVALFAYWKAYGKKGK